LNGLKFINNYKLNIQGVESAKISGNHVQLTDKKNDSDNNKAPIIIQLFAENEPILFLRPC